ncbi:hypothetical protein BJY04DRAFT_186721, partial [Aspergillus karnatakaensis]|uniref:uncharacterized protein n=1 Tax=Aspergillus karnatakaensis TaxID=1810916 RepID=UPI003CCE18A9
GTCSLVRGTVTPLQACFLFPRTRTEPQLSKVPGLPENYRLRTTTAHLLGDNGHANPHHPGKRSRVEFWSCSLHADEKSP